MVAITTVVIGTVQLNLVAADKAERRIDDAKAEETFNAQVALVKSVCKSNAISLPLTFNSTMNGHTLACTVTDNDSTLGHSYRVASTGAGARNRSFVQVIGGRQTTHPFYYALWTDWDLDATALGVSTTSGGSVYSNRAMTLDSASSISGDAFSGGTMTMGTGSVAKNCIGDMSTQTFHTPSWNSLQTEATTTLASPVMNSLTFLSLLVNGHYALHYNTVAASFSGLVNGKGTMVFDRGVTITGNVTYLSGAARAVFIVKGNLTINSGVTRVDGMWYVDGDIIASGTTTPLQNFRGSFITSNRLTRTRPLNIAYDPAFWTGRNEALRHCVPGFWPTPVAGLMR